MKTEYSKSSLDFLKKCDEDLYRRILKKIEQISEKGFLPDSKRIEGRKEKSFRVRGGKYRISYVIFKEKNILFIANIDKRSKVYE